MNPCPSPARRHRPRPVDQGFLEPTIPRSELQALRLKAMAELEDRYSGDPTFGLVKSIDRQLEGCKTSYLLCRLFKCTRFVFPPRDSKLKVYHVRRMAFLSANCELAA